MSTHVAEPSSGQHPRATGDTDILSFGGTLAVRSFGLTHPGRVRPANEDQFLVAVLSKALQVQQTSLPRPRLQYSSERGYLFVVADGLGGHAGGAQASALTIDSLESFVLDTLRWFLSLRGEEGDAVLAEFQSALRQAEARLFDEAARHPKLRGMATTLTLAYALNGILFVAHVGDSRCYLLRGSQFLQLTRDHTVVQDMVRRGHLAPEEAVRHRLRHVVSNVIGGNEPGLHVEAHKLHLEAGDRLLLCTDGLTEMVPVDDIRSVLESADDPQVACEHLVAEANARGGRDNITVIVARFDPAE